MMTATGMLFLSRGGVRLTHDGKGEPTLTLQCVDRIANYQVEPWALFWKGQAAVDFYATHGDKLTPGTPMVVQVQNLRSHTTGRTVEITARVKQLTLAPAAHTKAEAA
jgi:hypothetical protein